MFFSGYRHFSSFKKKISLIAYPKRLFLFRPTPSAASVAAPLPILCFGTPRSIYLCGRLRGAAWHNHSMISMMVVMTMHGRMGMRSYLSRSRNWHITSL